MTTDVGRNRPLILSITHMLSAEQETEFDIGEARQAAPYDHVAGWCISGTGAIIADPGLSRRAIGQ